MTQIQQVLTGAIDYARPHLIKGQVATYIPELAKADPGQIGICIKTADGQTYKAGECAQTFTMQSIAKTVSLILALQSAGFEKVFSHVGMEPTGDPFNSMIKLETTSIRPLNPMINAGAIATVSCIEGEHRFKRFLQLTRRLCGRDSIELDRAVYLSEKASGQRNRSMAYLMQSEKLIEGNVERVLDLYFRMCSVSVNAEDLANYGLLLANDGVDIHTGERVVQSDIVRVVKTLMLTCGMYDGSGEYAIRVGIPSKSGVGGGILSAVEGRMGIGTFSPALDKRGNSVGGVQMLEYVSHALRLHYFAPSVHPVQGLRADANQH